MKNRIVIGLIVIVIIAIGFSWTRKKNVSEMAFKPENELGLKQFLDNIEQQQMFHAQIYHLPFSTKSDDGNTPEGLLVEMALKKNTIDCYSGFFPAYIGDSLNNFSPIKQRSLPAYYHFRYCCMMKSLSNKYIRFSIALPCIDTIFINGQPYEASPEIVDAFLKLLPAVDYEEAVKYIQEIRTDEKAVK